MNLNYIGLLKKNNIVLCSGHHKPGGSVFLFPGHGAQYVNMLRELAHVYPVVQQTFNQADCIYQKLEGKKLTDCFITSEVTEEKTLKETLYQPRVMQPAIFCCNMAMFYLLKSDGYYADCYVGHSLGELSALCAANVFDFETGLQIAYHRGRCAELIRDENRGIMLSVNANYTAELEHELLAGMDDCCISIVNSARHFNISGSRSHIEMIQKRCEGAGVHATILNVTHAFHSDCMLPAVAPYREAISGFDYKQPEVPVLSTILERFYTPEDFEGNQITEILASQLVKPFNFRDIILQLARKHYKTFIEVGPCDMLGKLVQETTEEVQVMETNNRKKDDIEVYELYKAAYQLNQINEHHINSDASTDWKTVQNQISRITMYPQCVLDCSDEPLYTALAVTNAKFDEIREVLEKLLSPLKITKEISLNDIYRAVYGKENSSQINKIEVSTELPTTTVKPTLQSESDLERTEEAVTESLDAVFTDAEAVKAAIRNFVQEKTGYPAEFLEDDLDFEADLGIDSVKQSEIFANIMKEFDIQAQENLKEYNTISKAAMFVMNCKSKCSDNLSQKILIAEKTSLEQVSSVSETQMGLRCNMNVAEIHDKIVSVISEKTGYPAEFLEDDLDFEADLGIDSVKQSEIFANIMKEFDIQAQENLKEYNTISKAAMFVMNCKSKCSDNLSQKTLIAEKTSLEQVSSVSETQQGLRCNINVTEIHDKIVSVISEKTGYPKEILEDELELEADLGIDSVKQADIFAKISEDSGYTIDTAERIKDYNTIAKITEFIVKISQMEDVCSKTEKNNKPVLHLIPEEERTNRRCVTVTVPAEFDSKTGKTYDFKGKTVLLIADTFGGGITEMLCQKLHEQGANPVVISEQHNLNADVAYYCVRYTDEVALEKTMQRILNRFGNIHCVINLSAVSEKKPLYAYTEAEWESATIGVYNSFLLSAREVYPFFEQNKADTAYFAVTNIGDCLGYEIATEKLNVLGAISAGFLKGMERELRPLNCKLVDFTDCSNCETAVNTLLQEFSLLEQAVEICYDANYVRKRPYVIEQPLTAKEKSETLDLNANDVIFVTGGSRGIVHEFIITLFETANPQVVFTGRTPLPKGNEPWLQMTDEDFAKYKSVFLIEEKKKNPKATIREVEDNYQKMANARKLMLTLTEWKAKGYRAEYMLCDAANLMDVRQTAEAVIQKYGKITGIVNGAGLPALGLVPKKIIAHSQDVVRVKANSFFALVEACANQNLKFFYSIGSISGRFGMDGQVDYSAGADLIVRMTCAERRRNTCCKYAVIGWTAWADTGMAMHESVKRVQQGERGLEYISIVEGKRCFAEELFFGGQSSEALYFGKLGTNTPLGQLDYYDCENKQMRAFTTAQGFVLNRSDYPLLDQIVSISESCINAVRIINTKKDRHLLDHKVEKNCVFAGVMHIESCCELIRLFLENRHIAYEQFLPQIDSFTFKRFIKVYADRSVTLRLSAKILSQTTDAIQFRVAILSDFVNQKGVVLQKDLEHSSGTITVRLTGATDAIPYATDVVSATQNTKPFDLENYYYRAEKYIYFGDTFRYVKSAGVTDDHNYAGTVQIPTDSIYFYGSSYSRTVISPVALDNIGRFMLFHEFETERMSVVPTSMDGILIRRYLAPGEIVTVKSECISTDENTAVFSLKAVDADGKLIIEMQHVVLAKINSYDLD